MKENFFLVFFSLVRLSSDVEDKYLRIRLIRKINQFFDAFVEIQKEKGDNVAQNDFTTSEEIVKSSYVVRHVEHVAQRNFNNLLAVTSEISELIEMFEYLKIIDLSPTLLVQKNLLSFKSAVLDFQVSVIAGQGGISKKAELSPESSNLPKNQKVRMKLGDRKVIGEKILAFVRNQGESSAREIISAFAGVFSKRTVQRHLVKLVKNKELAKKGTRNSIKYSLT